MSGQVEERKRWIKSKGIATTRSAMPIPPLNGNGLLIPGIHVCTIDEIGAYFAVLNHRPRREELWSRLSGYLSEIQPIGIVMAAYVDGSFATNKSVPGDIDLVLEFPPSSPMVISALRRTEFDFPLIKRTRELDVWPWHLGSPPNEDFLEFFQEIKPKDLARMRLKTNARKGILKVEL